MQLASLDDLFSTQASRDEAQREKVQEIPLEELHPFAHHPFKVLDDDRMRDTADSIREYGVLVPAIARPRPDGGYELIAGHRRKRGCELAGLQTMPVIVRELDDDAATIMMIDSNIQRENILPSERAFAYQMKLEALKHQGLRTSSQLGTKLWRADESLAEQTGMSRNQVQRFIRLTNLIPALLDMVDSKKIAFNPAVELSYLTQEEQGKLVDTMHPFPIASPTAQKIQSGRKADGRIHAGNHVRRKEARDRQGYAGNGYPAKIFSNELDTQTNGSSDFKAAEQLVSANPQ